MGDKKCTRGDKLITSEQLRAARALVRMDQKQLAEQASVSAQTIKRLEKMDGPLSGHVGTIVSIQKALEAAGVEFIPENGGGAGVRLHKRQC